MSGSSISMHFVAIQGLTFWLLDSESQFPNFGLARDFGLERDNLSRSRCLERDNLSLPNKSYQKRRGAMRNAFQMVRVRKYFFNIFGENILGRVARLQRWFVLYCILIQTIFCFHFQDGPKPAPKISIEGGGHELKKYYNIKKAVS